ncbi:hypothetical protein BU17DRAFT_64888 [Hysterangium stoloniferum]|nr:hypothetical protein BU17DRAFT_64888 [Hysterangium stoloniferum]
MAVRSNAGHMEFLKLESWETFEKQIRSCFVPKGYKMYVAALANACNALGPIVITAAIYKYQLLFHAHPMLLLHIMVIPDFNLKNISFNNLVACMSMQWESLVTEPLEGAGGVGRSPLMPVGPPMLGTPSLV